jgi:hypothetical protein
MTTLPRPIDQVARHAGGEARAAHENEDLGRELRQEYGGLSGGIAAADQATSVPVLILPSSAEAQ